MPISIRAAAIMGLGLVGTLGLAARPTVAQNADPQVQRSNAGTAGAGQAARGAAATLAPAVIAGIDMERVINEYDRYKESSETFKSEAMKKQKDLEVLLAEAKQLAEQRDQFGVGTPDYQKFSDQLADAQAKFEAQKNKISQDFTIRESNAVAEIYNDIRYIVDYIAKKKGVTFVVQVGPNNNITGENPNDVMAAVARNVVYHDPAAEITDEVITTLNAYHGRRKSQQGSAPAPAAPATGSAPAPAAGGN
ncbi:OmpH family outer membrane protein [Tautonia plasticadhaerens]|uniref:Outer membrane protein (OmpH-like) n=1 Tax=Tautonia plasticadhaerens TaxID=2527974 RepID=A0A518H8W5_9BACT|nr:OmpH family outer membrane protein [Tautonia plasticadhaerens]QDV37292.1 Outer membrane protein (OmpH-like) [Tautonia plasticadhaerens]